MVKRAKPPYPGHWNFLGGKIDGRESPTDAARRELREESGIEVPSRVLEFRGIAVWPCDGASHTLLGMYLFAAQLGREPRRYRQTSLLHEGVVAWLRQSELSSRSLGAVVPNYDVLLSCFVRDDGIPVTLFHLSDTEGRVHTTERPISIGLGNTITMKRCGPSFQASMFFPSDTGDDNVVRLSLEDLTLHGNLVE